MPNRLANETSPYLLQHADNPVDWYPWGDEAFATRARRGQADPPLDRLLGLPLVPRDGARVVRGSAETASVMNEHFVSIKVDREERPDVDSVYMDAVVALTGSGGWPLTVFLTPDGEPFFGGTYFPPEPRHGLPRFREVLTRRRRGVATTTATQVDESAGAAGRAHPRRDAELRARRRRRARPRRCCTTRGREPDGELRLGVGRLGRRAEVPARAGARVPAAARRAASWPRRRSTRMAAGGMYDLVGGGFHRYSVDERWLVPHFEKMLYDNALLAVAYLHGWHVLGKERYREVAEQTVEYMLRELALDGGGLRLGAGRRHRRRRGADVHVDAATGGAGRAAARRSRAAASSCAASSTTSCARELLRDARRSGRSRRATTRRSPPGTGSRSRRSPSAGASSTARLDRRGARLGEFLLGPLSTPSGRLHRTWRDGVAKGTGYLEDYANVANGLLRAARRDRRAALARGGAPARAARGRAVRRRRERRLLPDAGRRRAARRPQEGLRRPPGAERQLDARLRAAAPRADLRRRRARGAGASRSSG